jgi:hypothetical protein
VSEQTVKLYLQNISALAQLAVMNLEQGKYWEGELYRDICKIREYAEAAAQCVEKRYMGVARITAWMIQSNDVQIIDKHDRTECWTIRDGSPHALMLSCQLDKRHEMEEFVAALKANPEPL